MYTYTHYTLPTKMTCFSFLKALCHRVQKTKKNKNEQGVAVEELLVAAVETLVEQDKRDKLVTFPQLDGE
jgi:hypothetical protein